MNPFDQQFTLTTADDQQNYFSGDIKYFQTGIIQGTMPILESGTYRIIDGKMYKIVSGLPLDEVRTQILER